MLKCLGLGCLGLDVDDAWESCKFLKQKHGGMLTVAGRLASFKAEDLVYLVALSENKPEAQCWNHCQEVGLRKLALKAGEAGILTGCCELNSEAKKTICIQDLARGAHSTVGKKLTSF